MGKGKGFLINVGPTLIVLAFLQDAPRAAFDIAEELEERSNGQLVLQQSTLYPLLNKLQKQGLIVSEWQLPDGEAPRRVYRLTEKGQKEAESRLEGWFDYADMLSHVLRRSNS